MVKALDLAGHKYHRLTVLERSFTSSGRGTSWLCRCDCGKEVVVNTSDLRKPHRASTKSCGCLRKESKMTHNMSNTKLYQIYANAKGRCCNPNNKDYKYYGGKGIRLSEEWSKDFLNFYEDMRDGYKEGLELDRRDSDGDYSKGNCRWVTHMSNIHNTPSRYGASSKYKGVSKVGAKWVSRIRQKAIGRFTDEKEAALAYNKAASKLFGEYAYLNKIEE